MIRIAIVALALATLTGCALFTPEGTMTMMEVSDGNR